MRVGTDHEVSEVRWVAKVQSCTCYYIYPLLAYICATIIYGGSKGFGPTPPPPLWTPHILLYYKF